MKKIIGDKPSEFTIHTYMEISQGYSLCSYFSLMSCFSFYLFSYKIRERKGETSPALQGLLAPVWGGGIGERR
jgi:hypothetical protein